MRVTVGDYVKMYRRKRGMTQVELAKRADYTQSHISELESNQRVSVSFDTLRRICEVLEMDFEHLSLLQESLQGSIRDEMLERAVRRLNRDL